MGAQRARVLDKPRGNAVITVGRMRRGINTIAATRSRYPPYANIRRKAFLVAAFDFMPHFSDLRALEGGTGKRTPIEITRRSFLGCWKN